MAEVRIRGDAAPLEEAKTAIGTLADEYSSNGLTPDEIWPRLTRIRDELEEFETEVKRALKEAS